MVQIMAEILSKIQTFFIQENASGSGHETVAVLLPGFAIYQVIAKPGNKTATVSWPDPSVNIVCEMAAILSSGGDELQKIMIPA